jgi:hypothetical protein
MLIACSCGKKLKVSEAHHGKSVRCPGCQTVLKVPHPTSQAVVRPSAPSPKPKKEDDLWGDIDSEISRSQPVAFNPASVQLPAAAVQTAPSPPVSEPEVSDEQQRPSRWNISEWSKFKWKGLGGSLLVLLLGLYLGIQGGKKWYKRITIDREPVATTGDVVGVWEVRGKRFYRAYIIDVSYSTPDGVYRSSQYVNYDIFYDYAGITKAGNSTISLEYAKSDPAYVRILNNPIDDGSPAAGIIVCLLACIGFAIFFFVEFEDDDELL